METRTQALASLADLRTRLEELRKQEIAWRTRLAEAYASLAYHAGIAEFKTETRAWEDSGDSLQTPIEHMQEALEKHSDCGDEIRWMEMRIEDAENDLADPALWAQEVA